jgi:hypothetical protein
VAVRRISAFGIEGAWDGCSWPAGRWYVDRVPIFRDAEVEYKGKVKGTFIRDTWMIQWRVFVLGFVALFLIVILSPRHDAPSALVAAFAMGVVASSATLVPAMITAWIMRANLKAFVDFPILRRIRNVVSRRRIHEATVWN